MRSEEPSLEFVRYCLQLRGRPSQPLAVGHSPSRWAELRVAKEGLFGGSGQDAVLHREGEEARSGLVRFGLAEVGRRHLRALDPPPVFDDVIRDVGDARQHGGRMAGLGEPRALRHEGLVEDDEGVLESLLHHEGAVRAAPDVVAWGRKSQRSSQDNEQTERAAVFVSGGDSSEADRCSIMSCCSAGSSL